MVREIVRDVELLQKQCKSVKHSKEVKELIQDLVETAKVHAEEDNCVGLAANQIGSDQRVIVCRLSETDWTVMINPVIVDRSRETWVSEEGCLSLEGTRTVKRHLKIKVMYKGINNKMCTKVVSGFPAAIVQHEIDHLNGRLI